MITKIFIVPTTKPQVAIEQDGTTDFVKFQDLKIYLDELFSQTGGYVNYSLGQFEVNDTVYDSLVVSFDTEPKFKRTIIISNEYFNTPYDVRIISFSGLETLVETFEGYGLIDGEVPTGDAIKGLLIGDAYTGNVTLNITALGNNQPIGAKVTVLGTKKITTGVILQPGENSVSVPVDVKKNESLVLLLEPKQV